MILLDDETSALPVGGGVVSSHLRRRLIDLIVPTSPRQSARRALSRSGTEPARGANRLGPAYIGNGSGVFASALGSGAITAFTGLTLVVRGSWAATTQIFASLSTANSAGAFMSLGYESTDSSFNATIRAGDGGNILRRLWSSSATSGTLVFRADTSNALTVWLDGVEVGGSYTISPGDTNTPAYTRLTACGLWRDSVSNQAPSSTSLNIVAAFNDLSVEEARAISQDWRLLFEPEPEELWLYESAGGSAAVLEAAAVAALTGTAALSTSISLAAAATASAAATAALSTSISLAAAATASVSATADLSTTAAGLAAAASAEVVASAALSTAIPLAASSSASVTSTAALTTSVTLAAAATAAATGTAALTTAIPLAADATASVSAASDLTTTPAGLNASASASATGTAALTTAVQLQAAAAATIVGEADLTATSAAWAAAATLQAQASAALTTAIQLAGAGTASGTGTAALTTAVQLAADATASVNAAASLDAAAAFAAAAMLQAQASAALTTAVLLQAAGTASVTAAASFGDTHIRSPRVYLVPAEDRTYVAPSEFRNFTH